MMHTRHLALAVYSALNHKRIVRILSLYGPRVPAPGT